MDKEKEIYKSQEELIGDWLDYLSHFNYLGHFAGRSNSNDKEFDEKIKEMEKKERDIYNRMMNTIGENDLQDIPLLKFIKENNLLEIEIKVILYLYMEYLEGGYQRGSSLLTILENIVLNPKEAYIERKRILDNKALFDSEALVMDDDRSPFRRSQKSYILSGKMLSLLEGNEETDEEMEDSGDYDKGVFEIIEPRKSLNDVILKDEVEKNIKVVLKQIENKELFFEEWGFGKKFEKGKGLIMMFYGPPGTGKTLTAEAIAHELGYKLYIVSLSDVLNPYYGVTEKNIKKVFEKADESNCILLLDEVDSFISKRSRGGTCWDSSHNRKISLFLRLIENFDGVAILTTNLPGVLDSALERRVSLKLEFPEPDKKMRRKLWELLIPDSLPVSKDLDFEELACNYKLTGGEIKNVIVNAARRALLKDKPVVTQKDLIEAISCERIKSEEKVGFLS